MLAWMRQKKFELASEAAWALFARSQTMHLATTRPDGTPLVRALHGVVCDGVAMFHAAPVGEKMAGFGRTAVASAIEVVAEIPSYFVDPERACPATTYYRSAQITGVLEAVPDPVDKARMLEALMAKYQPEGGHAPIAVDSPLYRKAIQSVAVVRLARGRCVGRAKLGQHLKPKLVGHILMQLWRRGWPGDPAAIDAIAAASPAAPRPAFLAAPPDVSLCCAPAAADQAGAQRSSLDGALGLLRDTYWNRGLPPEPARTRILRAAHLGASAWVVAHGPDDRVIATGRALSDGGKIAWVFDVAVAQDWRGRGIGSALLRLLLDHPRLRMAEQIRLATRDAQAFYAQHGFVPAVPWPTDAVLARMRTD